VQINIYKLDCANKHRQKLVFEKILDVILFVCDTCWRGCVCVEDGRCH